MSTIAKRWRPVAPVAVFLVLLAVAVLLQLASGVYRTERGHYPDEAAHFTNGLLIREYVRTGLGQSPLHFAEEYYLSFPKVALLMWPPLLHISLGALMLLPFPPAVMALLFMAALAAWIAFRCYQVLAKNISVWAGAVVGVVFLALQIVQDSTTVVMVDLLVAAMALEAALWMAKYWETNRTSDALFFGLFTALACLAKGNGVAVVMMCPFMILFSGAWRLLKERALYFAAALVAIVAGPFVFLSWYLYRINSSFSPTSVARAVKFTRIYLASFPSQTGWLWTVAAVLGIAVALLKQRSPIWLAMASLWVATIMFHATTSQGSPEYRYITMAYAPFLILAALGVQWLAGRIPFVQPFAKPALGAAMAVLALSFFLGHFAILHRDRLGFADAVQLLRGRISPEERILVASDGDGEGAFVSEFAAIQPRARVTIVRSSKFLTDSDWLSHNMKVLYATPDDAMDDLEASKVGYLVIDESPALQAEPYVNLANRIAQKCSNRLERIAHFGAAQGMSHSISVYKVKNLAKGPPKKIRVSLKYSLGGYLER
ncbi:MAG TPA: hypothetical protein VLM42_21625 [Bryobacteraceae bacterium]|nr:hypothetical protein [Bryobacteraceae bacterium]